MVLGVHVLHNPTLAFHSILLSKSENSACTYSIPAQHTLPDQGLLHLHLAKCQVMVMDMSCMVEVVRDICRRDLEFKEYASWLGGTKDNVDCLCSQLAVSEDFDNNREERRS